MKTITVLVITGIFTATLAAQTVKRHPSFPESRNVYERAELFMDHQTGQHHLFIKATGLSEQSGTLLKSSLETKQKLDSVIYEQYDNTNGQWVATNKYEYGYNANGKVILQIRYKPQSNSLKDQNQWIGTVKSEYSYDNNNILTQGIMFIWDNDAGNWVFSYKSEYSHDSDRNLIQVLDYSWDENTNQWVKTWKIEFTYDANGYLTLAIGSGYDDDAGQWVYSFKAEYNYDNDGNLTMETDYDWDENQWTEDYKYEYEYDGNGYLVTHTEYYWDGQWLKDSKYEYTYDNNGNMILEEEYYWDGQWLKDGKYEYVFDDNGNLTEKLVYNWDENAGSWEVMFKDENTYNNSYPFDELVLPIIYDEDYIFYFLDSWWQLYYHHMLLTTITSYPEEGFREWNDKYKTTLHYSEVEIVGIVEENDNNIRIYPNPAGNEFKVYNLKFKVESSKIELYDLNGRKILEKQIPEGSEEVKINVSRFHSGVYMCRISTEKGSITKKLIIQK